MLISENSGRELNHSKTSEIKEMMSVSIYTTVYTDLMTSQD